MILPDLDCSAVLATSDAELESLLAEQFEHGAGRPGHKPASPTDAGGADTGLRKPGRSASASPAPTMFCNQEI